ncbi:MAG: hypothetical protein AAF984_02080 [Verrucomicrobiota bacterium]
MSALPDRFDLLVRRAKEKNITPERQIDLIIGGIFALADVHFINRGTQEKPTPHFVELEDVVHMLVFTHTDKADTFSIERGDRKKGEPLSIITMKPKDAVDYAIKLVEFGCEHWLVNPGPFAFSVPLETVKTFREQWLANGSGQGQGFWIPNMTDEEEDFWQEHGL